MTTRSLEASPDSPGAEVRLSDVGHAFVHGSTPVVALWDLDLTIRPGEFVSLVGPSGCGKTTVLSMLAGLTQPSHGKAEIDGSPVLRPRRDVSYMFARDCLMPWRSVRKNVEFGMQVRGVARRERRETADEWLRRVGLNGFEESQIGKLSQGMRQRVAIARTLALKPRLILMDEPFAALDAQTREILQDQFVDLWQTLGCTVVFVTHDLSEAIRLSDRVLLIGRRPGRVVDQVAVNLPHPRRPNDVAEHQRALAARLAQEVSENANRTPANA